MSVLPIFLNAGDGSFFYTNFYTSTRNIELASNFEGNGLERKLVLISVIVILFASLFGVAFRVERVQASGTIYIRADGSIDPSSANIMSVDNVTYIFTGNNYDEIVVERDNIVVDGAGYTLQGTGSGYGITLSGRSNVTLRNIQINAFDIGVYIYSSFSNTVSGNNITNNRAGIFLVWSSNSNIVSANMFVDDGLAVSESYSNVVVDNFVNGKPLVYLEGVSNVVVEDAGQVILVNCNRIRVENLNLSNTTMGVQLLGTNNTTIAGNNITNNCYGITLSRSSNNSIVGNDIRNNSWAGIGLSYGSSDNRFYHNNFINNTRQVDMVTAEYADLWDDGYPSGGNYWSDYNGTDVFNGEQQNETGSDGIGDTAYVIDVNNIDSYPLMGPISFFNVGTWGNITYHIHVVSNSTFSDFYFSPDEGPFAQFWVAGQNETRASGFCRVTIPKDVLWVEDGWTVYYGSVNLSYTVISDEECTYLHFVYQNPYIGVKTAVNIYGTHVIPEFPSLIILPLFIFASLMVVLLYKRKRVKVLQNLLRF